MKVQEIQPFAFPGANTGVLALLKAVPTLGSVNENSDARDPVARGFSVPGILTKDIHLHIEANNRKVAQEALHGGKDGQNGLLHSNSYEDDMDIDSDPSNFVNLDEFSPKSLQQQLTTITIQGLPLLKKGSTERILQEILGGGFQWSMIESEVIEKRPIFVRIGTIKKVASTVAALENLAQIVEGVIILADSNIEEYSAVMEKESNGGQLEKRVLETVKRIVLNPKNKLKSLKSGTEDLDQVMSYYRSYKVDPSELVDVPNDMKQTIVKDIIRFRSKVLEIERDRRKQEIEEEKKKAKTNLKRLFADIKEVNYEKDPSEKRSRTDVSMGDDEDDEDDDDDDGDDDVEYKGLDDAEYEKVLKRKQVEQRQSLIRREKIALAQNESKEKLQLIAKLNYLKDYENDLISNKARYIDQFILFADSDDPKMKLYFGNYSEYLNIRKKEKAIEETKDLEDQELEAKLEAESNRRQEPVIEPTKTVQVITQLKIGSLSSEQLSKIKGKIGDLFEEYLGLREVSLIEFVYQHLLDNDLESLVEELVETLDDDAPIAVDELRKFIQLVAEE